jgi:glycerophosphoryl diester phosphodiesterase
MIVIGHRGAAGHAPENTRAAFARGLALGADALECDVHLSKDGVPVVIHDDTLDRTTSGRGPVRDQPWAALRTLDAGSWFGPRFRGERLWRLDDLLAWAKPRRTRRGRPLGLVIEIKRPDDRPHPGIADKVARAIQARGLVRRSTVISFDHAAVARVKALLPKVGAGLLFRDVPGDLDRRVARTGADAVFPRRHLVTPDFVAAAHARGWTVGTWTADAPAEIRRLRVAGVDALATNFPDRAS